MKGKGSTVRQKRLRIVNALAAITTLSAALLVAAPASALAEPSVVWETSLDNGLTPAQLFGHADGKVTAAACGAPSGDAAQARTYTPGNPAGSTVEVPNNSGPRLYACTGQSTFGKDGTLYAAGVVNGQPALKLLAYKDGQLKWSASLPSGCDDIHAMTMGVNGNVYAVVSCNGSSRLVGYTPDVATGSTEPRVALNVAITGQAYGSVGDRLAAYGDGLVLQLSNGFQYFTYSGSASGSKVTYRFKDTNERAIASDANGRTFYPVAASPDEQNACGNIGWGVMAYIQARTPEHVAWTYALPERCTHVIAIRPLFNGGAVALLHEYDDTTPGKRRLVGFDGNGNKTWATILGTVGDQQQIINQRFVNQTISVTVRGDVLLQQTYELNNDTSINARRVKVSLISGASGHTLGTKEIFGETNGYIINGNVAAATTNGLVYVVLARCNWDYCGSDKKLYAIDFDGVDQAFPRGAVWKFDQPWFNYAALGDSYSSGEGVPPFEPVSEIDRCHRSYGAYSKLLDGSPELRLRLTSNPKSFVACSGAKTTDVINGQNGEPSQLTALTVNKPDLVTITIGGNDVEFGNVVTTCIIAPIQCDGAAYLAAMDKAKNNLPTALNKLFAEIKKKIGPRTRVLVVGYPQVVPETSVFTLGSCPYLTNGEKTAARSLVRELNFRLYQAVQAVNNVHLVRNFEFVDATLPNSPFLGHEACMGQQTFFNEVILLPDRNYSFHPNRKGADAYASLIAGYLRTHPA